MAETPKLDGDSVSSSKIEFGEMGIQQIAISDQVESPMGATEMSDTFIVDIENLAQGTMNDNISANSRISVKLQRNLSRKGSQRGENNKPASGATHGSSNGKPVASLSTGGCDLDKTSMPAPLVSLGTKDPISKQPQQTITITTENRCSSTRRNLKQRTSFLDPRRVVLLFATLSSMGTILLIYLTLAINKFGGDNYGEGEAH